MSKLRALLRHPGSGVFYAAVAWIAAALCGAGWLVSRRIDPFPHFQWQPMLPSHSVPTPALPSSAMSRARSASRPVGTPTLDPKATLTTKESDPTSARSALPHGAAPAIPSVAIPPAEASPPPSSPPSKSTYFIQLGAFAYLTHVRELARQVARIGYRASITKAAKTGGAIIYRVRIDHAADRSSAEKLVAILKQRISGARLILLRRER